jgi:predicted acyltransferase
MQRQAGYIPIPRIELGVPTPRDVPPMSPPPIGSPPRLMSLDVFRGLVILAMLLVNNLGDADTTGYFWKHADWPAMSQGQAWRAWWGYAAGSSAWQQRAARLPLDRYRLEAQLGVKRVQHRLTTRSSDEAQGRRLAFEVDQLEQQLRAIEEERQLAAAPWRRIPLFTHCTLADYVMPAFMLIIGVAIPFSVAAARMRGTGAGQIWMRTLRRVALLIVLGWILCYFRDDFAASLYGEKPWTFELGMDVLQLLGLGYLVARIGYALPLPLRGALIAVLMVWHWALLRFMPQGPGVPTGTFTPQFEAIGYLYSRWPLLHLGNRITVSLNGLLSIPPAAATMLIGTLIGDWLARDIEPRYKVERLALWGVALALFGFLWAFDLPFNKPRWSPAYLLYVSGVGAIVLAVLYTIVEFHKIREWSYFAVVLGSNAIAVYWLSIMAKVLLLNTPRVADNRFGAHVVLKYATLAAVSTILAAVLFRFARWCSHHIGPAACAVFLLALVPTAVMWTCFLVHPLPRSTATDIRPFSEVILSTLKTDLGAWAGGWIFTITFVAFWWLVLDEMYRRKIFWKV